MSSINLQRKKDMKVESLTKILTKELGRAINQSMIAECLGVTRQTISNRIKNNSELTVSEVSKIEKYFNINILNTTNYTNNDDIVVDFYPDIFASCGNGRIVFSQEKEIIYIPKALLSRYSNNKQYSMICASGDSMSPYINSGDKLIIEHINGSQIIDNKIYVFFYNDELFVKRLSKNIDEIIIKSDNPNYNSRTISGESINNLNIIGEIVGIMRVL